MIYSEQERRASSAYFYMDPSALVKRYHDEKGTGLVNKLFKKLVTSQRCREHQGSDSYDAAIN